MDNKFGKDSVLNLSSKLKDGIAVLDNIYFTAPFKIMKPFPISNDTLKIMLISASAGIMEGDVQDISIHCGEGTHLKFISQAYEKIHKMSDGQAIRNTKIKIEKNATLNYMPLPTIPFKDSSFVSKISVELEDESSKLILTDILSCGRAAIGEKFQYSLYKNLVEIRVKDKLHYRDNTIYNPEDINMSGFGMYEGYSHFANIIFVNYDILESIFIITREILYKNENVQGDITYTNYGDVVIRILGNSGDELIKICEEIISNQ